MTNPPIEFKRLLVADDFTPHGSSALRAAVRIAKAFGAEVDVVHVLTDVAGSIAAMPTESRWELVAGDIDKFQQALTRDSQEKLRQALGPFEAQGLRFNIKTMLGAPYLQVIHAAREGNCDLVLTGTRGGSSLRRILVGSTAQRLVRHCPAPVWVAREREEAQLSGILAAIDFSEVSAAVLRIAASLAVKTQAKLDIVHVVEAGKQLDVVATGSGKPVLATRRINHDIRERLQEFVSQTIGTIPGGVNVIWGKAWEAISRAAKRFESELVVVGTVGRGGVPGILLGNTAEKLLYTCPSDVLAVKPPSFVCTIEPPIRVS